jgi:23S rRNA (uracil1939-C5)-methyltransferase
LELAVAANGKCFHTTNNWNSNKRRLRKNLKRIGKVDTAEFLTIIGSDNTTKYRNKLEFTFSNKRFLTNEEIGSTENIHQQNALGYHAPRILDKII